MYTITEPRKRIPVLHDVDVVVAGGGIAGTIAAIAAARHGAKTVIIERFGALGGNIGPGMWAGGSLHLALAEGASPDERTLLNQQGMGGIPEEFCRRVVYTRPGAETLTEQQRRELEKIHFNDTTQHGRVADRKAETTWSHSRSLVSPGLMGKPFGQFAITGFLTLQQPTQIEPCDRGAAFRATLEVEVDRSLALR